MKRTTIDLSAEKALVSLAIMNTDFLTKIAPILKPIQLQSSYSRIVTEWVLEFFESYRRAPEGTIQDIYERKKSTVRDEDALESIAEFLSNLSDEYDPERYTNLEFFVDASKEYIRRCGLETFETKLRSCIQAGELDKADQLVGLYHQVDIPNDHGISIIHDHDEIRKAFTDSMTPLFRFPGALGKVCGNFYRGDVSGWMAYQKGGKSYGLIHSAEEAMRWGAKVVFISLEMRKAEAIQRCVMSLQGKPAFDRTVRYASFHPELEPGASITDGTTYSIVHEEMERTAVDLDNLDKLEAEWKMRTGGGDIRFFFLPAETTSIEQIDAILDNLMYYQNYVADMVVIDYADLIGGGKQKEYRHNIDDIYKNLRRMAQERNIHVMTASQASASDGASKGEGIGADNFAEDKRKGAHAAKYFGIYATPDERSQCISHVKSIVDRYEPETYDHAIILNCYPIGRFCLDSKLSKQVEFK